METSNSSRHSTSRLNAMLKAFYDAAFDGADDCPHCGRQIERGYDWEDGLGIPDGYPLECECLTEYERELDEQRRIDRAVSMLESRISSSGIPSRFANADTDLETMRSYYLYGKPGTGKTHTACALLMKAMMDGHTALFTSMDKVIMAGFDRREQMLSDMRDADILCIDDIGRDETSPWAEAILFRAVDDRYAWEKPIIVTSNYSPSELANRIARNSDSSSAHATVDRLCGITRGMCDVREMVGHA